MVIERFALPVSPEMGSLGSKACFYSLCGLSRAHSEWVPASVFLLWAAVAAGEGGRKVTQTEGERRSGAEDTSSAWKLGALGLEPVLEWEVQGLRWPQMAAKPKTGLFW